MTFSTKLGRLHFLNALFAPLTGHDLYLAEQIDSAITTSLDEAVERPSGDPAFLRAAVELFGKLAAARINHGFFHWDAAEDGEGGSPLFARARLIEGLKRIAVFPEATVLVTNLRAAHCPPDKRWTERRRREYDETLTLLRELTASRTRPGAQVNILFL